MIPFQILFNLLSWYGAEGFFHACQVSISMLENWHCTCQLLFTTLPPSTTVKVILIPLLCWPQLMDSPCYKMLEVGHVSYRTITLVLMPCNNTIFSYWRRWRERSTNYRGNWWNLLFPSEISPWSISQRQMGFWRNWTRFSQMFHGRSARS